MNIYSAIILCFVPLVTVFLLLKILVESISIVKELLACLIGLIAVIPITVLQFCFGDLLLFKNNLFFSLLFRSVVLYGLIEEQGRNAVATLASMNLKESLFGVLCEILTA